MPVLFPTPTTCCRHEYSRRIWQLHLQWSPTLRSQVHVAERVPGRSLVCLVTSPTDWQLAPNLFVQSGLPFSLRNSGHAGILHPSTDPVTGNVTTVYLQRPRRQQSWLQRTQGYRHRRPQHLPVEAQHRHGPSLSKKLKFGGPLHRRILGEAFNIFNHMNITSAIPPATSSAEPLSLSL